MIKATVHRILTLGLTEEPRMGLLLLLEPGVLAPGLSLAPMSPVTWLSEADFFMLGELEEGSGL